MSLNTGNVLEQNTAAVATASPHSNSVGGEETRSTSSVYSVEQLNRTIRQMIEGQLMTIWVRGELSNFKAHSSGHFYFSLKDQKSQIRAVMFRGYNAKLKFKPHDGMEVILRGKVTVYEPRGEYQISCEWMEPVGAGALQKSFEQLKEKLKLEGLFEASRKRPLPAFPRHIALVTSPTGAAIRDMINVLNRRNKNVRITLVPTIVQGEAAAPKICEALEQAWKLPDLDVVIIGRGGGSMEDLWAFNDEKLARLIHRSPVPVISAVGHEIDFTISDFVADVRAPTPSAAAELVSKNSQDVVDRLLYYERMLKITWAKCLSHFQDRLRRLSLQLVDPQRRLQDMMQKNDDLFARLVNANQRYFQNRRLKLDSVLHQLKNPRMVIEDKRAEVKMLNLRFINGLQKLLQNKKTNLERQMLGLETLSPLKVLTRGYSITLKSKKVVKDINQVSVGDEIQTMLAEGTLVSTVIEKTASPKS